MTIFIDDKKQGLETKPESNPKPTLDANIKINGGLMKKYLMLLLLVSFFLMLVGCGAFDNTTTSEGKAVLQQTIDQLSNLNSYELTINKEQTFVINGKTVTSQKITNQKVVFDPFVHWSRTDSTNAQIYEEGQVRTMSETYQVMNGEQLDIFMRFSADKDVLTGSENLLSEWNKVNTSTKEQADWIKNTVRSNLEAQIYLLSSNIETFKLVENIEPLEENLLKYEGHLKQTTILEAYQKHIRGIYVAVGLLKESKNMTLEDLKVEITNGEVLEIKEGIPKFAYSKMPVPVTLWVDDNTYELKKVMIDETEVMQAYMEKEMPKVSPDFENSVVSKAMLLYEIESVDEISEIPMPK